MKKVNLFIIGAPRCGTTALSEYLREHPDIYMSTPKEPHFFCDDIKGYNGPNSFNEYEDLFKNGNNKKILAEASVLYLYSKVAVKNIYKYNADARIIIMVRDHVDFLQSYHSKLLMNLDENITDFKRAWRMEDKRKKGIAIPKNCRDEKLLYYREMGKLGEQVERVFDIFPKDQVKIILFKDFKNKTQSTYEEVLKFIGLKSDNRNEFPVINSNKQYRSQKIAVFFHPNNKILRNIKRIKKSLKLTNVHFLKPLINVIQRKKERKQIDDKLKKEIIGYYKKDLEKLEKIISKQ